MTSLTVGLVPHFKEVKQGRFRLRTLQCHKLLAATNVMKAITYQIKIPWHLLAVPLIGSLLKRATNDDRTKF